MTIYQRIIFLVLASYIGNFSVSQAALSLDRTRIVVNEDTKALSLHVKNRNQVAPYLAQVWLENDMGKKINEPLMALPPVQRIDAEKISQIKLQMTSLMNTLPKDRESLFYFYLREIPIKSKKANTVVLAVESKLKVFYRPKSIAVDEMETTLPGLEKITINWSNGNYEVNNLTPYYFTITEVKASLSDKPLPFDSIMIPPFAKGIISVGGRFSGDQLVLVFVTDYGESRALTFKCADNHCVSGGVKELSTQKTE